MVDLSDYKEIIKKELDKQKPTSTFRTSMELEVRFKNIDRAIFYRVLRIFQNQSAEQRVISDDYYLGDDKRLTVSDGKSMTIIKTNSWYKDIQDFDVRISLSREDILDEDNKIPEYPPLIRKKDRRSFKLNGARLDITKVLERKINDKNYRTIYEIECEFVGDINSETLKIYTNSCNDILKLIQDTNVIYTMAIRDNIITEFNKILGSEGLRYGEMKMSHRVLAQARNLKRKDCVYGGLIGGEVNYTLTQKIKGLRKLLFITKYGICLVFPPLNINLLISAKNYGPLKTFFDSLIGTIIDGENLPRNLQNTPTVDNLYYPFDVMAFRGSREIQKKDHNQRLETLVRERIYVPNLSPIIKIVKKDFKLFKTLDELHIVIQELESELDKLPYETDGYIVTPYNSPYILPNVTIDKKNLRVDDLPLHKRSLTKYPEICKLKPWDELTIDLLVEENKLFSRGKKDRSQESKEIEFTGSKFNPFSPAQIIWSQEVIDGTIGEFGPVKQDDEIKLELRLIRDDKIAPNTDEIAASVWDDINEPLTVDTLLGKDFNLMFQYHSSEKTKLLETLPPETNIIDIGSGRGGTLGKMSKFNHIVCVEPNPENYTELERRANISFNGKKMADKITLLKTGGEDYRQIITGAIKAFEWDKGNVSNPVCITMFLSLSFFFSSEDFLNRLSKTIRGLASKYWEFGGKGEVKFLFTTIEKKRVLKVFEHKSDLILETTPIKIGTADLVLSPPNKLYINIPDSIVKNQSEYLVDLEKFKSSTGLRNMKISSQDKEKFLSEPEKQLSSCYVTGTAVLFPSKPQPEYKRTLGMYPQGGLLVESVFSSDFFSAVGKIFDKQGNEIRKRYAAWLIETDPRYPTEQDAINTLYNGKNPKKGIYKDQVKANINYYTTMNGDYHRYLNTIEDELKGFDYIMKHIQEDIPLPHQILLPLGYCLDITINVCQPDLTNKKVIVPTAKYQIIIMDNGDSYSPVGVIKDNTIVYIFI